MKIRFFILIISAVINANAADILSLVKMLDLNDTVAFESSVKNAIDANAMREDNNKTILMYASWVGNDQAVHYLVEKGADVNAVDSGGATALHLAIWKGYDEIALYLLSAGASAQTMSLDGMTPRDIAIMKQNQHLIDAIDAKVPKLKSLF